MKNEKAVEMFLKNLPKGKVKCPNVDQNCFNDSVTGWKCPHAEPHQAGQMCRQGVCPVRFGYLECNP